MLFYKYLIKYDYNCVKLNIILLNIINIYYNMHNLFNIIWCFFCFGFKLYTYRVSPRIWLTRYIVFKISSFLNDIPTLSLCLLVPSVERFVNFVIQYRKYKSYHQSIHYSTKLKLNKVYSLNRCPMASKEEVEMNQDKCAICWEPMKEARKLPCAHLFHK